MSLSFKFFAKWIEGMVEKLVKHKSSIKSKDTKSLMNVLLYQDYMNEEYREDKYTNFDGNSEQFPYAIMFIFLQLICDIHHAPVDSYIYNISLKNYLLTCKSIKSYRLYFVRCLHVYKFIEQMRVIMQVIIANLDADFHIRLK